MAIRIEKEDERTWSVFDDKTGKNATIVRIYSYSAFEGLKDEKCYRVDYRLKTIATAIENWQKAKSIAIKAIRGEYD